MDRQPDRDTPRTSGSPAPQPLLGSAPSRRTSRFAGFSVTPQRLGVVVGVIVLVVLGSLLPYLALPYIDHSGDLAQEKATLFPAVQFVGGLDPLWLPGYRPGPATGSIEVALNVLNLGVDMQQIGLVVAVLSVAALFQNEINKFFWWPLHLSGWILALSPVALFIGVHLLHQASVSISLKAGWIPIAIAGVLVLVVTFRAHSRIDSYASI
jgi:hypothetical protein